MPTSLPQRPIDATLSVTKAARLLGVHPNTVRAWSDAGRLRYYRINPRGDRRYRLGDLQRFLATAQSGDPDGGSEPPAPWGGRRTVDPASPARFARQVGRPEANEPSDPLGAERQHLDIAVAAMLIRGSHGQSGLDSDLDGVARTIREAYGHHFVGIWEVRDGRSMIRAAATDDIASAERPSDPGQWTGLDGRPSMTVDIPSELGPEPWGVLQIIGEIAGSLGTQDHDVAVVAAEAIARLLTENRRQEEVAHLLHRADALRRVAGDIGSRLDLDRILTGLVEHAMVLFGGDRGAVFLQRPDGRAITEVSRGLSPGYLAVARELPAWSLGRTAAQAGRPLFAVGYGPGIADSVARAAVVQEGFDTICTAPLADGSDLLGTLDIYHDRPHAWAWDELETVAALATQASVAIRAAQDYERMATWAAQLQSIQQLGARLSRLSSVAEIGRSIASELRELIDYHNARVYRIVEQDLIPVAMLGQVGEYVDETPDQLRLTLGEGITGWVAQHRVAQVLGNAAADPRASTIPGTEDDLDESMLLAPMVFDDRVLGVLVLSKLGLDRFTDDDLRLLVIYASLAAQAMANADTTERLREQTATLERQLRGQRELLQISELLLATLDSRSVLESITDRLGRLVESDNVAIEVIDPATGRLTPLTARGVHAAEFLEPWGQDETGIATWVVAHNEPVLIADERNDSRVNHFRSDTGVLDGSLIVVPLRGRVGAIGVLTIERLGLESALGAEEFELVQLFAAQVSIALQNAEIFQAVEIRAQTDGLTGLLNHGTFQEWLERHVREGTPFSLIMLDLDDFRDINNDLGHQAGDEALRRIAGALVRAGRETDQVFRYGGDEFAFILPHTDEAGARRVADRARSAVSTANPRVSASVGTATYPQHGLTARDVLLAADRACFVAKRSGRDQIATAEEGLALAAELTLQAPTPVDSTASPG